MLKLSLQLSSTSLILFFFLLVYTSSLQVYVELHLHPNHRVCQKVWLREFIQLFSWKDSQTSLPATNVPADAITTRSISLSHIPASFIFDYISVIFARMFGIPTSAWI